MKPHFNKKIFAVTVLLVLLCTPFMGLNVNAVETPKDVDTTKTLSCLKGIFQIDTDKYDATLTKSSTRPWNDVSLTVGQYELIYSDYDNGADSSVLTVTFNFWNSDLVVCALRRTNYDNGTIHYTQKPDSDLRKAATNVLQRYQTYTNDKQIPKMINLLNTADLKDGYTKTNDNLQITVQIVDENIHYLTWSNTVNNADYSRLTLAFDKGELIELNDDRAFYSLGSRVVNISEEQAINIAIEQAANLSYEYNDQKISDFNIVTKHIQIQPATMPKPAESLLVRYPIWIVDLPLTDIYPGMVSFIRVMLWTDTGEVISVQPLGAGFPNDYIDSTQKSSLINSRSNSNNSSTPLAVYIAGACLAIIIPIAIIFVLKKIKNL